MTNDYDTKIVTLVIIFDETKNFFAAESTVEKTKKKN